MANKKAKTHRLKTLSEQFQATKSGRKAFEIRTNDRGFRVGDILNLYEVNLTAARLGEPYSPVPTGEELDVLVTYIARGPDWGIPAGRVVMSISLDVDGGRKSLPPSSPAAKAYE